ncbi:MAG: hypothetical protein HETSPECPRED_007667 [Heterodermia speciosa]|uniref:MAGE domain-containing protein n=1 Tax=Heterodermia speciosa TaxID=116794 RepID=A0A8H3IW42_9LECA|nr:MAG: hypothetical protein HETSPECPRED_007667 [Heterodermia speciosa]
MPLIRKRRSQADAEPSPAPTRRRRSPSASEASSVNDDIDGDGADGEDGTSSHEQMVKKLVRLAMASEYSRIPVKRTDIASKVMAPGTGRLFKRVFDDAQQQLRNVFGMELTELPQKEKVTVAQKRAAQRAGSQSGGSSSKSYVLISTLPQSYRTPAILTPSRIPTAVDEAAYTGLYTFIVGIISFSQGGMMAEGKLESALARVNADNYFLNGERTENILKRMERQGYIIKIRERDGGGEETVDYMVGPRGKAEIGERGVAAMARRVYAKKDAERDELERKLVRSLGEVVLEKNRGERVEEGEAENNEEEEQS